MSKIGQQKISLSKAVNITIDNHMVKIKGPNGELSIEVPKVLAIEKEGEVLSVKRLKDDKETASLHGLYRQLIANAIAGVENPWQKKLEVVGTGFNVKLQGEDLVFKVGYSHPVVFKKREGIKFQVEGNNKFIVSGSDKQLVGEIAYQIKMIKKPDIYKGKGIKYTGETIRIKPGKKAKVAGTAA